MTDNVEQEDVFESFMARIQAENGFSRLQAEQWLVNELEKAEASFGEGEDIETFAKEFHLGAYRDEE